MFNRRTTVEKGELSTAVFVYTQELGMHNQKESQTYGGIALLIMSADNVQIFEYSELAHRAMGWPGEKLVDVR